MRKGSLIAVGGAEGAVGGAAGAEGTDGGAVGAEGTDGGATATAMEGPSPTMGVPGGDGGGSPANASCTRRRRSINARFMCAIISGVSGAPPLRAALKMLSRS
ncbi:MAG: hypothetical protein A2051_02145 [Desulfovibrionales bacterium GWA2_65_9]|nr:MAG: hypothetical protein A2051_02145 [Desulfovibrionales bacterium GWA2_65_9]